ncbi:XRE family transcriptional regulator [Shimia sp. CNT1-13L.2]|uniref:helix-turn-helix domain-containing protein n=1 Tax=Shimia sp. CNT1-13L.2 TaxID=2959663 RepID=UPI0020CD3AAE|nr:XRE family transcriptional regulator [Shimia sp. CNT1-13L.2]MCP9483308.1 XRE family transcriptional regulator [Shimia sp. CNT1-13L.2]
MGAPSKFDPSKPATTDSLVSFGSEVRQLRRARQMTLKEVAHASGVSLSHLSAIERGSSKPSIDVVERIAEALGVSSDWFFARRPGAGPMEQAYVVRKKNRRNMNVLYGETVEEAGYSDALLSSSIGGSFCMGIADYEPRSSKIPDQFYKHGGELHGYILQGELELLIGEEQITLRQGDSYSFPASVIHDMRNMTDSITRLIWANGPVIIPKEVIADKRADEPGDQRQPK